MSGGTSSLVTSVPDFDGYQWRKYGQKQIEGAIYARYSKSLIYFLLVFFFATESKHVFIKRELACPIR